jgi:hypothetical protein
MPLRVDRHWLIRLLLGPLEETGTLIEVVDCIFLGQFFQVGRTLLRRFVLGTVLGLVVG